MSALNAIQKRILEQVFQMEGGYVLDFSDKTMSDFFKEQFNIKIYDKKYDYDFPSGSKANRLRGIFRYENDTIVSKIILDLIDYKKLLTDNRYNPNDEKTKTPISQAVDIANELRALDDLEKNGHASYTKQDGRKVSMVEIDENDESIEETPESKKANKKADEEKIKQNAELIKTLRDNHQSLTDVVEIFCQNSKKPTKELNDAYLFLVKKIENIIKQLDLKHHRIYFYKPFKKDIYTAEYEWNGDGSIFSPIKLTPKLSWDAVRPHMYETHSKISEIYRMTEETEEMSDDEKRLEQINALISEKRTIKTTPKKDDVKKMEILHKYEDRKTPKKILKNSVVKFDDTMPAIFVDEVEIPLPEYGKEHYFCRAVWKRKANEATDWSKIYNDMEGKNADFLPDKQLWRYVYDAKNDVNKRVKDIAGTTENLFDWNEKTIKRLY